MGLFTKLLGRSPEQGSGEEVAREYEELRKRYEVGQPVIPESRKSHEASPRPIRELISVDEAERRREQKGSEDIKMLEQQAQAKIDKIRQELGVTPSKRENLPPPLPDRPKSLFRQEAEEEYQKLQQDINQDKK